MPQTSRRFWSRRRFLIGLAGGAGAVAGGFAYVRWVEPGWLAVRVLDAPLGSPRADQSKAARKPIRLLHLSDFHASDCVRLDFIAAAVREGLKLKPDLICVTGDFITSRYEAFTRYAEILKPLANAAPTYAVLGNHDGGSWIGDAGYPDTERVRKVISTAGMTLLHNRSVAVPIQGRTIRLVGVGDLWAEEVDATAAFAPDPSEREKEESVILLSHNPDAKDRLGKHRWDLMLSGHTHGGQCDLVFFGTPFAPVRDRRFVRGLGRWEDRWIHVTAGVGNLYGMRLNCRPDVSLLRV